jgi:hypothetical protein
MKNKKPMEFTSSTAADHALFKTLGLKPFNEIPSGSDYFVGEANFENGAKAKIWVRPMPAQFWKFEIVFSKADKKIIISTGSGTLSSFWNTIKLFADGMFEVNYE